MSEYNDIVYDPSLHTHTSCIEEISNCDMVILIIGSRFGGRVIPQTLSRVDFEKLESSSNSIETLKKKENISITQLEILKAIEQSIPVFSFIEERLWHDHALYEKNKGKEIIDKIDFPSIAQPETAKFIFEFINFLRHRTVNNSIAPFAKIQDIENNLRRQWAGLFQRLLTEQRTRNIEARRIDSLTEQFEDLKTAILTSIGTTNEKEIARGVVRFRRLIDFIRSLSPPDFAFVINETHSWEEFLDFVGIVEIYDLSEYRSKEERFYPVRGRTALIKKDRTFFECRIPVDFMSEISLDWDAFVKLSSESRSVITDALVDMRGMGRILRYIRKPFEEVYPEAPEQTAIFEIEHDD